MLIASEWIFISYWKDILIELPICLSYYLQRSAFNQILAFFTNADARTVLSDYI